MPLIFIKKCLFPSFPLVCALGRPASMPVTSPRWDILGKLEKEEAMDYLQTWFANENLLAGMICMTLWQCSPSGTWVVMLLGLTAVLGGFRTAQEKLKNTEVMMVDDYKPRSGATTAATWPRPRSPSATSSSPTPGIQIFPRFLFLTFDAKCWSRDQ